MVAALVMITGYGLWEMRRWSWYLLIIAQILVTYENAILVQAYAQNHHKLFVFFLSIALQMGVVYRIAKEIRVPYFFPKIRWWENNPRYRLSIPVTFKPKFQESSQGSFSGEILDLSVTGCFIKIQDDQALDQPVVLQFKVFGYDLQCEGTIVWRGLSTVTHPKGIGVKFSLLQKSQKRSLRSIHKKLKKIADLYRRSRYLMSQEEFVTQLEKLESPESA